MICLFLGRYSISKTLTIVLPSSVSSERHHSLVFTNDYPQSPYLSRTVPSRRIKNPDGNKRSDPDPRAAAHELVGGAEAGAPGALEDAVPAAAVARDGRRRLELLQLSVRPDELVAHVPARVQPLHLRRPLASKGVVGRQSAPEAADVAAREGSPGREVCEVCEAGVFRSRC